MKEITKTEYKNKTNFDIYIAIKDFPYYTKFSNKRFREREEKRKKDIIKIIRKAIIEIAKKKNIMPDFTLEIFWQIGDKYFNEKTL